MSEQINSEVVKTLHAIRSQLAPELAVETIHAAVINVVKSASSALVAWNKAYSDLADAAKTQLSARSLDARAALAAMTDAFNATKAPRQAATRAFQAWHDAATAVERAADSVRQLADAEREALERSTKGES